MKGRFKIETSADRASAQAAQPLDARERRPFINSSQTVTYGKLASGLTFQTYDPNCSTSDESLHLEDHEMYPQLRGEPATVSPTPYTSSSSSTRKPPWFGW